VYPLSNVVCVSFVCNSHAWQDQRNSADPRLVHGTDLTAWQDKYWQELAGTGRQTARWLCQQGVLEARRPRRRSTPPSPRSRRRACAPSPARSIRPVLVRSVRSIGPVLVRPARSITPAATSRQRSTYAAKARVPSWPGWLSVGTISIVYRLGRSAE
jgi:hypothetical protein